MSGIKLLAEIVHQKWQHNVITQSQNNNYHALLTYTVRYEILDTLPKEIIWICLNSTCFKTLKAVECLPLVYYCTVDL